MTQPRAEIALAAVLAQPRRRKEVKHLGEEQDDSMIPSQKLGNGTPKSDTAGGERVPDGVPPDRGEDAERHGDDEREDERAARQLERQAEPVENQARTGSPVLKERPRSPRGAASTQLAYWAGSGRSRPSRWRTWAATSCENSPPISTASGPPGASRIEREEDDGDAGEHQPGEPEPLRDVGRDLDSSHAVPPGRCARIRSSRGRDVGPTGSEGDASTGRAKTVNRPCGSRRPQPGSRLRAAPQLGWACSSRMGHAVCGGGEPAACDRAIAIGTGVPS